MALHVSCTPPLPADDEHLAMTVSVVAVVAAAAITKIRNKQKIRISYRCVLFSFSFSRNLLYSANRIVQLFDHNNRRNIPVVAAILVEPMVASVVAKLAAVQH